MQQQEKKNLVSGIVKDVKGEPLIGVNVQIKDAITGTSTDIDGKFTISVPTQDKTILLFSYLGYKTEEVELKSTKPLTIILHEDAVEIGEVVVTGMFSKPRESFVGAVTSITSKDLQRSGNSNLITSIRNIDPSFNISDNISMGSDPNAIQSITIRGNSSLSSDVKSLQNESQAQQNTNQPLFILDGFEMSITRLMDLDENQIESITLLKDASSTAMYGTRGANGVVVITTKKPQQGRLLFTYKGGVNVEVPDLTSYSLQNSFEKLEYEKKSGLLYSSTNALNQNILQDVYNERMLDAARGVNTQWLHFPLRVGVGHKHSLRIEGGENSLRYTAGLSLNNTAGVMKGSSRKNMNGNIFLSYSLNKLTFQNNLQVSGNWAHNSPYGSFSSFAHLNPYWKPYDDEGNIIESFYYKEKPWEGNEQFEGNPLYNATLPSRDDSRYYQMQNNFSINYQIMPDLFFRGRIGITLTTDRSDRYKSLKHTDFSIYTEEEEDRKGSYTYGTGESFEYEGDFTLNYSKVFKEKHSLYVGLNSNFEQRTTEGYTFEAEGISNANMIFLGMASKYKKNAHPISRESISRRIGNVLTVNYTFDRRYFFDYSQRWEGSSKFGSKNRFAPFWSAGSGWNVHNEKFMASQTWVDILRLRSSVGVAGLQSFNSYQAMTTFKDYGGLSYRGWYGVRMLGLGNENLGWQKTFQTNLGTDIELFNRRLKINIDLYDKLTDNLVSDIRLIGSSGFDSYKSNIGKVSNRGFEIGANVYILRDAKSDLMWSVGATLAYNKNEIKEISNSLKFLNKELSAKAGGNPSFLFEEGQSINTIFAVKSLGIEPSNGKELYAKKRENENDPIVKTYKWDANDKVPCGVADPKFWGNISSMLRYKGVTLNMIMGYRTGGQMYNYTLVNRIENNDVIHNADKRVLYGRWQKPGDNALFKSISERNHTYASSRFVMTEHTLECRTLTIGYDWNAEWLKKNLGISYFNIALYADNLFHISTIRQERGLNYPFARRFSSSITMRF